MITVQFNQNVTFTEGVGPNGVAITHNNGGTYTLSGSGATGSGTTLVSYEGSWDVEPVAGDVVTWSYSDGDYQDSEGNALLDQDLILINCLDTGVNLWVDETGTPWNLEATSGWWELE